MAGVVNNTDAGALIEVWVVPGASQSSIVGVHGSSLKIRVSSPAEGGKANQEVARLLSKELQEKVILVKGMTSRRKMFQVSGVDADFIVRKLGLDL
jgi:uncharacterized protein (TIGR00251 family)